MTMTLSDIGKRLREIVEVLNDVADFVSHWAFLLEEAFLSPKKCWHYLEGFEEAPSDVLERLEKEDSSYSIAVRERKPLLRKIIDLDPSQKDDFEKEPYGDSLWLPLILDKAAVGALVITAKHQRSFSNYVKFLCESTIQLGMKSLSDNNAARVWRELRFGILHRKSFLAGQHGSSRLSSEYMDELLDEYLTRSNRLIPNQNAWSTIRLLELGQDLRVVQQVSSAESSLTAEFVTLVFRASNGIEHSNWTKLNKAGKTLMKETIDSWLESIERTPEKKVSDPDLSYLENFTYLESNSHIVVPSIHENQLVALFTFDSSELHAFSHQQTKALAILAAHAAPVIGNAMFRTQLEEHRKSLNVLHELGIKLSVENLTVEQIFQETVNRIIHVTGARAANMLLLSSTDNPELSITKEPILAISSLGSDFDSKIRPRHNGLTFHVLSAKKPLSVSNPDEHPGINEESFVRNIQAYICLPMRIQESIIGVLFVHYAEPHTFSKNEVEILELFANQAAAAIQSRRLWEGMEGLTAVAETLRKSPDFDSAMNMIVETARSLTSANSSTIFLLRKEYFDIGARTPAHKKFPVELPRFKGGLTRQIIDTARSVRVDDTTVDSRIRKAVLDEGTRSLVGVCLQIENEKMGVLYVSGKRRSQFTDQHVRFLETIANQASVALGCGRLLLKPTIEIEQSSSELFRIEDILKRVCEEIQSQFGFHFAAVQLIRREKKIIETVYGTGMAEEWTGLARHPLESDLELRDIQADIALADPPRIEIIRGWDERFDRYLYNRFKHQGLVRVFVPLLLVKDMTGRVDRHWFENCRWNCVYRRNNKRGKRIAIEMRVEDLPTKDWKPQIIGTVETGFKSAEARISAAQAKSLVKLVSRLTLDLRRASLRHVLETIVGQAMQAVRADSASLHFLPKSDQGPYLYEVGCGRIGHDFLKVFHPRTNGIGQQAIEEKTPKAISYPPLHPKEENLEITNPRVFKEGIRAMAAFPLLVDQEKRGVLYVHFHGPHRFNEDEIGWVKLFADQAAHAVHHVMIYAKMLDRTLQLRALNLVHSIAG